MTVHFGFDSFMRWEYELTVFQTLDQNMDILAGQQWEDVE